MISTGGGGGWRKDADFGVGQAPFKPAFVGGLSSDSGQLASFL